MAQKPQAPSAGFDFNVGKAQQSFSWTSEAVEQLMFAIEEGYKIQTTPFYEGPCAQHGTPAGTVCLSVGSSCGARASAYSGHHHKYA